MQKMKLDSSARPQSFLFAFYKVDFYVSQI